jgi:glycosyltransferase involved in cell wall biosynthesis
MVNVMQIDIIGRIYAAEEIKKPFSLCMMTLNEEASVEQVFDDIFKQTLRPSEIVIVDGGSTDRTVNLIKTCAVDFPVPVNLIVIPGSNPSHSRNVSVSKAKNELLVFLDFGCRYDKFVISGLVGPMMDPDPPEIVSGICFPITKTQWSVYFIPNWRDIDYINKHFLPSTKSMAITRSLIFSVGGFAEWITNSGDDTLLSARVKLISKRWVLNRDSVILWGCPTTFEDVKVMCKNYGFGNGEIGCKESEWTAIASKTDPIAEVIHESYLKGREVYRKNLANGIIRVEEGYPL